MTRNVSIFVILIVTNCTAQDRQFKGRHSDHISWWIENVIVENQNQSTKTFYLIDSTSIDRMIRWSTNHHYNTFVFPHSNDTLRLTGDQLPTVISSVYQFQEARNILCEKHQICDVADTVNYDLFNVTFISQPFFIEADNRLYGMIIKKVYEPKEVNGRTIPKEDYLLHIRPYVNAKWQPGLTIGL